MDLKVVKTKQYPEIKTLEGKNVAIVNPSKRLDLTDADIDNIANDMANSSKYKLTIREVYNFLCNINPNKKVNESDLEYYKEILSENLK